MSLTKPFFLIVGFIAGTAFLFAPAADGVDDILVLLAFFMAAIGNRTCKASIVSLVPTAQNFWSTISVCRKGNW